MLFKFSRSVIHRSKFRRMDCSLNLSYFKIWRNTLWVSQDCSLSNDFFNMQACFCKEILRWWSLDWSAKMTPSCNCSVIATLLSGKTEARRQDSKNIFPRAKFTRQVFCSFLSAPMWGKSRKHSFNTEIIVYFSISRTWTPHDIFLSDRNDPLWECWYNLSNLTNQRVYQELVHRNGLFKEMITGPAAPSLSSFLPFYFRLHTLSIQRAQLSRSPEQAMQEIAGFSVQRK